MDTAAPLRAICNLALVQTTDLPREDKLWHMMRGLSDAAATVRIDAARTLEVMDGREAALLLRLKARMREQEPAVSGQVFQSLLAIEGEAAIPFLNEFLQQRGSPEKDDALMEQAALALGSSRLPKALETLITCCQDRAAGFGNREFLLRALSSSRQEQALAFLIALVVDGRNREALAAVEALGLHKDSESIRSRVQSAVLSRENPDLHRAFEQAFQDG